MSTDAWVLAYFAFVGFMIGWLGRSAVEWRKRRRRRRAKDWQREAWQLYDEAQS